MKFLPALLSHFEVWLIFIFYFSICKTFTNTGMKMEMEANRHFGALNYYTCANKLQHSMFFIVNVTGGELNFSSIFLQ